MKCNISKKLISMGLAGTLLFAGAMPAVGISPNFEIQNKAEQTSYDFSYKTNSDGTGITITEISSYFSGSLTIPSTINSLPVTSIDSFAFYRCYGLTSVTIPNSVTSIGNYAFSGCMNLTSAPLPNSVTSLGNYVFDGCTSLTEINIPNTITTIGESAFFYCQGLTNVTIPSSVKTIGWRAFENCSNLKNITIPNSVTSIDYSAFGYCESLTSITIPNSVTTIGNAAFNGCSALTSISIPNGVTTIGDSMFDGCTNLASITIPNSVTTMGSDVVDGTTWLENQQDGAVYLNNWAVDYKGDIAQNTNLVINNGIIGISDYAFNSCENLTSVTIPNSVITIGKSAFSSCTDLTSVAIPNSVTSIGKNAFYNSKNVTIDCQDGSYAQTYAEDNNIPHQIVESPSTVYAMKTSSTYYYKNGEVKSTYESNIDGNIYKAQLQFNNSKTFLPIRSVAEAIGLDVGYDVFTGLSTVSNGTKTVKIIPDSTNIIVVENGVENVVNIGVAPLYVGGFIHVPVRAVIQEFGFDVNWHFEGYLLITDYELSSSEIDELKAKVEKLL